MHPRNKKIIVPIVVSILFILYFVLYFGLLITQLPGVWKYLLGILPLAFAAVMVKVCVERIHEIKEGEEDDLGQY